MQTRRQSLIEANINTWLGLAGSWAIVYFSFPLIPIIGMFWTANLQVGLCTVWSVARGYYVRRYFNRRHSA